MKYLLVDHPARAVLRVRINRPDRRNALDGAVLAELETALGDPVEPVVILGSTDGRAFCAGGDLSLDPDDLAKLSDRLFAFYLHLIALPNVVIAGFDGAAIGAGAQLLLCADLRVAGRGARISFLGATSGLALGTWRLPELVGLGRATDLSMTGRHVPADEALAIGLVDRVVDDADAEAVAIAAMLAAAPDGIAGRVKQLNRHGDLVSRLERERVANFSHRLDPSVIGR